MWEWAEAAGYGYIGCRLLGRTLAGRWSCGGAEDVVKWGMLEEARQSGGRDEKNQREGEAKEA